MLGLQHSLMLLPEHQVMVCRSIAQAAVAGAAAAADHKGEQDRGILGQGEGLEVSLVVVVVMILVVISLHEREGSGELAHVDGRHGTERSLRSRSGWSYGWLGSS
jgi:hypothetical protein